MFGDTRLSFDQTPLPREVSCHGQPDNIPKSRLESTAAQETSRSFPSDDSSELILFSESRYHFTGTSGVFVDQDYHASVKTLGA